jgi:hypothetical protein
MPQSIERALMITVGATIREAVVAFLVIYPLLLATIAWLAALQRIGSLLDMSSHGAAMEAVRVVLVAVLLVPGVFGGLAVMLVLTIVLSVVYSTVVVGGLAVAGNAVLGAVVRITVVLRQARGGRIARRWPTAPNDARFDT